MNYLSVCSGIEAATVAWHDLGFVPVAFSEIEKFPSEVLKYHYPDIPNLGDMTKYKEWDFENRSIGLVVGGTPCQSFSVAGLRKGLEDPRGNLALTFCGILDKFKPQWFVWENVPGVLNSSGGKDFGSFLSALAELGYGYGYRVLDAQYFGVPQRRRRVFVVGYFGDWRPPAKVLFESESLSRDTQKSKKEREKTTTNIGSSITKSSEPTMMPFLHQKLIDPLMARDYKGISSDSVAHKAIVEKLAYAANTGPTLTSSAAGISRVGNDTTADSQYIAYSLQGGGSTSQSGNGLGINAEKCFTLNTTDVHGVAVDVYNQTIDGHISSTVTAATGGTNTSGPKAITDMRVRRLTPIECERLQGFPDNYTNIKTDCPDGPRYKALGNSMAVPVMKWIGQRITLHYTM